MIADLFEILGTERALAEAHGRLLHEHGRADPALYARGILLYGQAKAAFDGLIESAKHQVTRGKTVDDVPDMDLKVRAAVDRSADFNTFVRDQVLGDIAGTRFGLGDLLEPAKLFASLLEAVTELLKERREAGDVRRKETLTQLDGLKWRPFEALMKVGGADRD
jgi:hypothetical protein